MMKRHNIHKFIIYICLLISAVSLSGTGLENSHKLKLRHFNGAAMVYAPESQLVSSDNVSNIKIAEKGNVTSGAARQQVVRSTFSYRVTLGFLCALAFLSGLFLLAYCQRFMLHSIRYTLKKDYLIIYIHDMDGRKRFS